MRELVERAYFAACGIAGRLLRASRYSRTSIVRRDGEWLVRKRRLFHAPLLIWLSGPLVRMLGTGVRVLPQRAWEERERELYRAVHETEIRIDDDGTLSLPCFPGITLADLLEDPDRDASARQQAIVLGAAALAQLHARGSTHGDAMAENVLVDLDSGRSHWFDFETVHDSSRSTAWRRSDDVRAFLATSLLRTFPDEVAGTLALILNAYGDHEVTGMLAPSFASAFQRPLTFHLGQAPMSFALFREIHRLLEQDRQAGGRGARPDLHYPSSQEYNRPSDSR